jgi:2-amino-4-hydroxy-6-hydroxymethyldihydropteridine diphosphokinase
MTASLTRHKVPVNDEDRIRTTAYIGLGANLGDREGALRRALEALDAEASIDVAAVSTVRETEPVGYLDQPPFLNAAARLETELAPRELLATLLRVEQELGRDRSGSEIRFGPRTIDLDLLLYGELELDEDGLTVPHPRLHERRFVLEPLAELAPGLVVPGRGPLETLLSELHSQQ